MREPSHNPQQGFVLITSLIFLAIITMLAVTAINSSTLQEKIAFNMRAQANALQYANAALREAEQLLGSAAFDIYRPAGTIVTLSGQTAGSSGSATVKIWNKGAMLPSSTSPAVAAFLKPATWVHATAYRHGSDTVAKYYIEELEGCHQANRSPDACATGERVVIYRITARAVIGRASSVTQSTFAKYY